MSENISNLNTPESGDQNIAASKRATGTKVGIQTTPSRNDLDAILKDMLDAEDQPIENDETSNAHSDMSSLLPFGNVIPSDCEESIATGPLDVSRSNSLKDFEDVESQGLRPNELFLDADEPFGSSFNRRRTSDQTVSSNESNSLSSILDSIGWSSRKTKVHHSRGLDKSKKGILYKFLSSNSDSAHNDRESSRRQREDSKTSYWAAILLLILCNALYQFVSSPMGIEEQQEILKKEYYPVITRSEEFSGGMGHLMVQNGVPKADPRPKEVKQYYKAVGKPVKPVVPTHPGLSFLSDPSEADKKKDTPLFWVVSKSGERQVRDVLLRCDGLTFASEYGTAEQIAEDKLKVIDNGEFKYINVETFSPAGLARAQRLGLASSKMANVIVAPLFLESLQLFDESNHGIAFTMIRHPVERALSMYEKLIETSDVHKDMALEHYARSGSFVQNNYLVRYLSGQIEGELTKENLSIAKEVLKKFVIGLAEDMDKSIERFERYFGFNGNKKCRARIKTKMKKPKVKPGKEALRLLKRQNNHDLELYNYAKELYRKQGLNLF